MMHWNSSTQEFKPVVSRLFGLISHCTLQNSLQTNSTAADCGPVIAFRQILGIIGLCHLPQRVYLEYRSGFVEFAIMLGNLFVNEKIIQYIILLSY